MVSAAAGDDGILGTKGGHGGDEYRIIKSAQFQKTKRLGKPKPSKPKNYSKQKYTFFHQTAIHRNTIEEQNEKE